VPHNSYDRFRGVVSLLSVQDGVLKKGLSTHQQIEINIMNVFILGDKISSCHTKKKYEVLDVGIMYPDETPTGTLRAGQVGFVCGIFNSTNRSRSSNHYPQRVT
jgi:translation factor GUF1, mitochondrial